MEVQFFNYDYALFIYLINTFIIYLIMIIHYTLQAFGESQTLLLFILDR